MFNIRHVVFDRQEGLRWYFIDTETKKEYFLSLNPKDIIYFISGINLLIPPLNKNHIKGNW
jgi:hypothetical protein